MINNIMQNNGFNISLSGIAVVFMGLVAIALVIHLFNLLFRERPPREKEEKPAPKPAKKSVIPHRGVPDDHLAAMAVAVEIYRKLHYDQLPGRVTFGGSSEGSAWKLGTRYGQRFFHNKVRHD